MNITTLPISYRPGRPFRILITPFVAAHIFRLYGAASINFPVNIRSLRNRGQSHDSQNLLHEYKQELSLIGAHIPSAYYFNDVDPEFTRFLQERIAQRVERGYYEFAEQRLRYCPCGSVEIPETVLHTINHGSRPRLVYQEGSVWKCRQCNHELKTGEQVTLVYPLNTYSDIESIPSKSRARILACQRDLNKKPLLISRAYRSVEHAVTVGKFMIDPDHCWIHYLDYLHTIRGMNDFVVVVGTNQIPHATLLTTFMYSVNPHIKIRLVVTPLLELDDMTQKINKRTTVAELLAQLGSPQAVQLFLAMLMVWNRETSRINMSDVWLIKKTLEVRHPTNQELSKPLSSLDDFPRVFNQHSVASLLLRIRQRRLFDTQENALASCLFQSP